MDDTRVIDYLNLLARLSNEQQQQLYNLGTSKPFNKDELICSLNSASDDVYLLTSGRIKIFELTSDGKEVILWFCGRGELIGFAELTVAAAFGGRQVNAQACNHGELLVINRGEFENFIKENPSIVLPIIQSLGFRLREISEVLSDITSNDVTSRVIRLLYRLSGRYGKSMKGGVYLDIALTHQEMADMIGTSRQTVTTVLGELKRQGMIYTEQRSIFIRDTEWMQSILSRASRKKIKTKTEPTSVIKFADAEA